MKNKISSLVASPLVSLIYTFCAAISLADVFDAVKFGAKGDGSTKDTAAIQKAIDAASAAGAGKVVLKAGTYLTGTIYLKSGIELSLAEGAVIKGSSDKEDYCAVDAFQQNFASPHNSDNTSGGHLIVAHDCNKIAITGPGRIDGNSAAFLTDSEGKQYKNWKKGIPWRPGQMIYIVDCRNVRIENVDIYNSPYWSCHLLNCEKVLVSNCRVRTERNKYRTWNGDGIDIDRCRDVLVKNCDIDTEDDSITLRASCAKLLKKPLDCSDVRVEDCNLSSSCQGIRVGVGEGVIRNCTLSRLTISNTKNGVSIISAYSKKSRGTDIHDIVFDTIDAHCEKFLDFRYCRWPGYAKEALIKDITFKNIKSTAQTANEIKSEPGREFKNIKFENCEFKVPSPKAPKIK